MPPPTSYPAANWTQVATNTVTTFPSATLAVNNVITGMTFMIPGNTTYRFALHTTGTRRYSGTGAGTCTPNTFTSAGINLYVGDYQISGAYVGYGAQNNPRFYTGQITFVPASPCTAPPVAGNTAITNHTPCVGQNTILSLQGASFGTGLTYQWESATALAGPYTAIVGATNANATVAPSSGVTYYHCAVTCSAQTVNSNPDSTTVSSAFPGGIYTIDSLSPPSATNFQSFSTAIAAISCGIAGPVVFNVVTGGTPYNEQVLLSSNIGATATNTVTINGNGNTLTYNGTAGSMYTLGLDGADYITVNNLNIIGTNATYALVCHLWNQADSNNFTGCTFTAPANGTSTLQVPFSVSGSATSATTAGNAGNNNIVTGCTMNSGYYSTCFVGNTTTPNTGNQLINSHLKDYYLYGSYNLYQNGMIIRGDTMDRPTRTTLSTFYGIYMATGCSNMLVEKNRIANPFLAAPTGTNTAYGVYCTSVATAGNENKLFNNVISDIERSGALYGMYLLSAQHIKVYNNTISLDYGAATAGTTYGIYATGTAGVDIMNNNISITRGGTGTKYCLYFTGAGKSSNYNNLYISAPAGTNNVGYYSGAFATLTAWQAANSGIWDQNSVDVLPMFASPSVWDYTPTNSLLDDKGTPIAAITDDILGMTRNATTPDVGAFEFSVPVCNGTPTAGTISGVSSVCPSVNYSLGLAGATVGQGISFQWYSSPAGQNTFTAITGATTTGYSTNQTAAMDYYVTVTCANGGASANSGTFTVNMNSFTNCYCTSNATTTADEEILNVTFGSINNTSTCTTLAPGPGSLQSQYSNYKTTVTPAAVQQGSVQPIAVQVGTCGTSNYNNWTKVFIDYNQNGLFTDAGEEVYSSATYTSGAHLESGSIIIPITATIGQTVMRVVNVETTVATGVNPCGTYGYGETEDYLIDVQAAVPCSGTPATTVATGPAGVCSAANFNLSASGFTSGLGITYEWQKYDVGTSSWVTITGATNPNYTVTGGQTVATDYRFATTCTNGGLQSFSNTVSVAMNAFYVCYCGPNTGITLNGAALNYLTNVTIPTTTLNSTTSTTAPGGYTLFFPTTASTTASLVQGVQYTLNTTHPFNNYYDGVWIDFDGNGTFDASEFVTMTTTGLTASGTFTVPLTATPGLTGLRVRNYYTAYNSGQPCTAALDYETEDYVITIVATTACTGTPTAGTISGPSNACVGTPFTLNVTGQTVGTGITYQWQSSPAGLNTFTDISGATNASYTETGFTVATDYQFKITCANGGGTATTALFNVPVGAFMNCYCIPTTVNGCNAGDHIKNVTIANINNNTAACISGGSYSNYMVSVSPGNLAGGASVPVTVVVNNGGTEYAGMWIDFDHSGTFDASEFTALTGTVATDWTFTGTVVVPGTALYGQTGMRFRSRYSAAVTDADACSNAFSYGETEDYVAYIFNPLVIKMGDIKASNVGSRNRVDWNTLAEERGDGFEVERSTDGVRYTTLGTIPAKGNASTYTYWDESPVIGINYYRLKLTSASNSYVYSNVVSAKVLATTGFAVEAYPNPVSHQLNVKVTGTQGSNAKVMITDVTGKVVLMQDITSATTVVNMNGISSGVYLVKYTDSEHTQTLKITKQ